MEENEKQLAPEITKDHFIPPLQDEYYCPICLDILKTPIQTNCGHHFCENCLGRNSPKCPLCRSSLNSIFLDKALERTIQNKILRCPISDSCPWKGELSKLRNHLDVCNWGSVKCSNCSMMVSQFSLSKHYLLECVERIISCQYCAGRFAAKYLAEHNKKCLKFPIDCPNHCKMKIARETISSHKSIDCQFEKISCEFKESGCKTICKRIEMPNHLKVGMGKHLSLVLEKLTQSKKTITNLDNKNKKLDNKLRQSKNTITKLKNETNNEKLNNEQLKNKITNLEEELQQSENIITNRQSNIIGYSILIAFMVAATVLYSLFPIFGNWEHSNVRELTYVFLLLWCGLLLFSPKKKNYELILAFIVANIQLRYFNCDCFTCY